MIKSFLILIIFPIFLFSSQQTILVVAQDFNSSHGKLEFYEDSTLLLRADVNLGTNGLAWGIGILPFKHKEGEPLKYEGDKRAPVGVFSLTDIFGYKEGARFKLPYLYASKNLICVDDSESPFYNQIIESQKKPKSFEYMRREDNQYRYGITVAHNSKAIAGRGSCIFMHIQKSKGATTAGCTSMDESDLKKIISLLDSRKNPTLIQIPKSLTKRVLEIYPQLQNSSLLKRED
jgi:L,D-peptidoglycan transpeptidase YkuD (ErfK/YbiS/YcfS/YnhG family)